MKSKVKQLTNSKLFLEQLGWFSTGLFLLSYSLASVGFVAADSLTYQGLNIGGALGYSFYAHKRKIYPSLFANLVWAAVGLYALIVVVL